MDAPRCPMCGRPCGEVVATREEIAAEIAYREEFFRRRVRPPARREADLRDLSHVALTDPAPLFRCPECDVYARGGAAASFEADAYDLRTLETLRAFHVAEFAKKEWVRHLLPPEANVLEIGSYVGGFMEVARSWGWTITGVDVGADTAAFTGAFHGSLEEWRNREAGIRDQHAANSDQASGIRNHEAAMRDPESSITDRAPAADPRSLIPDRSAGFAAAFIWNCFEQLPDPADTLRCCRELLRPPAVLVIRTPDAALYAQNRRRRDYLAYSNLLGFPHRFGFTPASLAHIATTAGFEMESIRYEPAMRPHANALAQWAREEEARVAAGGWMEGVFRGVSTFHIR